MQQTFDIGAHLKRSSIQTITIRELTGKNERNAKCRAEEPMEIGDELLAESIVEVDGKPVQYPFHGFRDWSSRTLEVVRTCFNELNGTTEAERMGPIRAARSGEESPAET